MLAYILYFAQFFLLKAMDSNCHKMFHMMPKGNT